ncbi:hypothetical protein FOZ61_010353 [Perkinsus olseni]|uniref:Rab-GAP TBC domain-containing protein n=1 Tax=Perkinsus olseni TaxID=32597 RepID=A0A7J6M341_PEROL|nr:hypothetical protein FOZ61_010353 [Perkinsus olseni]
MFSCLAPCIPVSVNASGYEPVVQVSDIVRAAELDNKDRWGFQYDDQMAARLNDYERLNTKSFLSGGGGGIRESAKLLVVFRNFFAAKRARREARFEKALKRYGRVEDIPPEELKEFGRKGFPDRHRVEVWEYRLEVEAVRSRHERDFYETLLRKDLPAKIGKVIEVDLRRTFPHHPAFQEDVVVERLRNILWAFAAFHPDVGYCQGMNFIAATMMMVVFDGAVTGEDPNGEKEELSFWFLSQFITSDRGLHNSGYYQPGMVALLTDMYAFDCLSGRKASNAHRHLEECGIQDMSWICVEWFQTAYSTVFSFDTVLRIWDPIMTEGWKVLFRVGVAIFKIFENEIDSMSFEEIMQDHKKMTAKFVDHNRLMKVAFYGLGVVKRSDIGQYRRAAPRHNPSKPTRSASAKLMSIDECAVTRDTGRSSGRVEHEELVVPGVQETRLAVYEDSRAKRDAEWRAEAAENSVDGDDGPTTSFRRRKVASDLYDFEGSFLTNPVAHRRKGRGGVDLPLRPVASEPNMMMNGEFEMPLGNGEAEPGLYESRVSLRNDRGQRRSLVAEKPYRVEEGTPSCITSSSLPLPS